MKNILQKTAFPEAPGGDRYEWKGAETIFEVSKKGRYMMVITASTKNGQQNGTGDDDDLRLKLDNYPFGQYESHEEMVSWEGFGTSAGWDGASLKGGIKTIYFLVELEKGEHKLQFFADGKPELRIIGVFGVEKREDFILQNLTPKEPVSTDRKGIPWMSFIFLRVHPKVIEIIAKCQSASQKRGTDGDNLKVVINGKILPNTETPTSNTYKNFYFSGDKMEGQSKTLEFKSEDLDFTENALELWYDESPVLEKLKIIFFEKQEDYLETLEKEFIQNPEIVRQREYKKLKWLAAFGKKTGLKYASQFLLHSLQENPSEVVFGPNDPLIFEIKKSKGAYKKILTLVKKELKKGKLQGEIIPDTEGIPKVNFGPSNLDLYASIHGIQKIEYAATPKGQREFDVKITLSDRYDFKPTYLYGKIGDKGEKVRIIHNFPIRIRLEEKIKF